MVILQIIIYNFAFIIKGHIVIMNKYKLYTIITVLIIALTTIIHTPSFAKENASDSLSYYFSMALNYYRNDSNKKASIAIQKAIKYSGENNKSLKIGKLHSLKGYILLSRGATPDALESFSKAKSIGIEINNPELIIAGYHGLGRTYIVLEDIEKAKENLELGLASAKKNKLILAKAVLYNAIGILEISRNNFIPALYNFNEYLKISISNSDSLSMVYAYVNIGEAYLKMDIIDSALIYINKANILNKSLNNAQATASIYGNYGSLAYKNKEYKKSIELINKSLTISFDNNFSEFIIDNYYMLIDDYKALHNVEKAISVFAKLDHYKDSIHQINDEKKYTAIHSQSILKEKEAHAKFWKQKYKNRNIILFLSSALIVVLIVLFIILFKVYNSNKIKYKDETQNLSEIIDEKNRELVTRIISEREHTDFVEIINKSLSNIGEKTSIDDVKKDLQSLKKDITIKEQITNNWDSFKIQFQKVHPNFFNSLLEKEPNLTQNELRMCAYIKMNMSTKEIANILNISDRSIQTSRYRLKKKLSLTPNTDLIAYIQAV